MERGNGETTRQMAAAPPGAIFIWCNSNLSYPVALAKHLGRTDLEIYSPYWLESNRYRGREVSAVVVDHAAELTRRQRGLTHA